MRQSSVYQMSHNLESQKLQYAMQDRLQQLGWREIEVIDEDLGRSAAGTVVRSGFERMVAQVCLGHAHTPQGETCWKRPSYGALYRLLTNPAYLKSASCRRGTRFSAEVASRGRRTSAASATRSAVNRRITWTRTMPYTIQLASSRPIE